MRHPILPSFLRWAFAALAVAVSAIESRVAKADPTVALGDSLTAEYEDFSGKNLPYPIPGFDVEATAYARVDEGTGWVSRSWVEVMGLTRGYFFDFGSWRSLKSPWLPPRLSGYELNWGIPGAKASQYQEFMTSSFSSNPLFFGFRVPLANQLHNRAKRVAIWLGSNDLRAKYGSMYDAQSASDRDKTAKALGDGLISDLTDIIDRVKAQNSKLQIVIGNLPDLGAAPSIKSGHTTAATRDLVSAEIDSINTRIAKLAEDEDVGLADINQITKKLIAKEPFYFGAVQFTDDDPEENDLENDELYSKNEPHNLFTRDGFHPNTALQIKIARAFIKGFNTKYSLKIASITDLEALKLLHISPREPYNNWIAAQLPAVDGSLRAPLKDPDLDGMTNLFEYAFDTNPGVSDVGNLPFQLGGPVDGISSQASVTYTPSSAFHREIDIAVQYKYLTQWIRVPADHIVTNTDKSVTVAIPLTPPGVKVPIRIKVSLLPPQGSLNTLASVYLVGTLNAQ